MSIKSKVDKDKLIHIIDDIILEEGLSGLSIRKVAAKANISIGGVQYIFGNKECMIKAISEKNEAEFNHQIEMISKDDNSKYSRLKAHIEYVSNYSDTEEFNKMSRMIIMLLQDEKILKEFQNCYENDLNSIDTSNEEGKKLRLAYLFSEALFTSLSLKYIKLSDEERKDIFDDLKKFLL